MKRWLRLAALEIIFWVAWGLIRVTTLGRWTAWKRNSLALGYWTETSDLDLTLYCASDVPLPKITIKLWRAFSPCGEWAAYTASDLKWANFANPFELARDPRLKAKVEARKPSGTEAFVFWLHMFDSDGKVRGSDPVARASRRSKWRFHRHQLESAGFLVEDRPFPEFVAQTLAALAPAEIFAPENESLCRPQRWLSQTFPGEVAKDQIFTQCPAALTEVARAQIHWELWGLLGQIRLRGNLIEVTAHFQNLANLFAASDPVRAVVAEVNADLRKRVVRFPARARETERRETRTDAGTVFR